MNKNRSMKHTHTTRKMNPHLKTRRVPSGAALPALLTARASYNYDRFISGVSALGTANWESTRHLASLGVRYKF